VRSQATAALCSGIAWIGIGAFLLSRAKKKAQEQKAKDKWTRGE